jgi:DNA gyrase/topoisomerase IV subunit A
MIVGVDSRERVIAEDQLRLLELLEAAMGRRDEVFEIVDSCEDADEAQDRIRELFGVVEPHIGRAVLDLQVSRWTRAERKRIADNADQIRALLES